MVVRKMPRIQDVLLPILKAGLPGVQVVSWVPDVEDRQFPILNVRRLGGLPEDVNLLDKPVVEITAFSDDSLAACENLLLDARQVIYDAWKAQTVVPTKGHISSYFETLGPTQFDSTIDDTWRVQMLVQLGLRPPRN
jgi:hypothetical protein